MSSGEYMDFVWRIRVAQKAEEHSSEGQGDEAMGQALADGTTGGHEVRDEVLREILTDRGGFNEDLSCSCGWCH
jgi:hypothetical protein